jgi:hypothetical protein
MSVLQRHDDERPDGNPVCEVCETNMHATTMDERPGLRGRALAEGHRARGRDPLVLGGRTAT